MMAHMPAYRATILANGRSTRWGNMGPKSLIEWNGQPLIQHMVQRLQAQTQPPLDIWINANADWPAHVLPGYNILRDAPPHAGHGPLSGMLSAMRQFPETLHLFVPTDMPLLPLGLAEALGLGLKAGSHATFAVSTVPANMVAEHQSRHRNQPCCCLVHGSMHTDLEDYLKRSHRSVMNWLNEISATRVVFAEKEHLGFVNLNEPGQLHDLPKRLPAHSPDCLRGP